MVALKDWPLSARTQSRKLISTYSDRKVVAREHEHLGELAFVDKYGPDNITLHALKKRIRDTAKDQSGLNM